MEWLPDLDMSPDERWAGFGIPIGLAFFMRTTVAGGVVALYPSPAGATESELDLGMGGARRRQPRARGWSPTPRP